jgi:predicted DCC family thiol-disulfide oxidoreductase YuxK
LRSIKPIVWPFKMSESKQIIFFDGVCGLCNHFIDFLFKIKAYEYFRFASLQGETAQLLLSQEVRKNLDSVILYQERRTWRESGAVVRIFWQLPLPYKVLGFLLFLIPSFIRNIAYKRVASVRYKLFGKKETCRLPLPHEREYFLN